MREETEGLNIIVFVFNSINFSASILEGFMYLNMLFPFSIEFLLPHNVIFRQIFY